VSRKKQRQKTNSAPASPPDSMLQAAPAAASDSRKSPRERVVLSGTVIFSDGSFTVPCRIKDLSETGACVVLPAGLVIPTRHVLIRTRARVVHVATVARIASPEFGVKFTSTHSLDGDLPSNLQYLRRFR
jgi:PilZ domain